MAQKQLRPIFGKTALGWHSLNGTLPFAGPVDEEKVEDLRVAYEGYFNDVPEDDEQFVTIQFEVQDYADGAVDLETALDPAILDLAGLS
jgi:hypothetical protein